MGFDMKENLWYVRALGEEGNVAWMVLLGFLCVQFCVAVTGDRSFEESCFPHFSQVRNHVFRGPVSREMCLKQQCLTAM